MAISLTLFGIWARQALSEQRQLETQQKRLQALRLAEAGIGRATARRAVDPQFTEEAWLVPAAQLDQIHAAAVRIRVAPGHKPTTLHYEATAEFPAGAVRRVQVTKSVEIPNPIATDRP
jgi:hypothetical protein